MSNAEDRAVEAYDALLQDNTRRDRAAFRDGYRAAVRSKITSTVTIKIDATDALVAVNAALRAIERGSYPN